MNFWSIDWFDSFLSLPVAASYSFFFIIISQSNFICPRINRFESQIEVEVSVFFSHRRIEVICITFVAHTRKMVCEARLRWRVRKTAITLRYIYLYVYSNENATCDCLQIAYTRVRTSDISLDTLNIRIYKCYL